MRQIILFSFVGLLFANPSTADIQYQDKYGFVVGNKIALKSDIQLSWQTLLSISLWWESSHSFSGKAEHLYLDVSDEKCFCEKWDDNWVRHLSVVHVQPNKKLVLDGALGPLQSAAIHGALTIQLETNDENTLLSWEYRVHGNSEQGANGWAAPVDRVLSTQFNNLSQLINKKNEK